MDKSLTIGDFKKQIETESTIPHDKQRLIYSGRVLKDSETIASYKIQDGHTVHLVKSSGSKPAASTSASASGSASTASNNNSASIPSNIAAGTSAGDPLAGLTGARYAGYGVNLPSADMFGPDGGLNGAPNEEQFASMMENPMFQEMMSSMLSNPQMVDNMISQNPMLRSMGPQVRELMQSPFFRQMLSNPSMFRQAMEMQRAFGGAGGLGGGLGGFGGAGAGSAGTNSGFPAPGAATNTEAERSTESSNNNTNPNNAAGAAGAQNPFAAIFPNGAPQNPFSLFGQPPANSAGNAGAGAGAGANPFFNPEMLSSLLGGAGGAGLGAGAGAAAQNDTRPPEERYEQQLRQLNDMGFTDFDRNVTALRRSGGSVQGAIDALLGGSI